MGTESGIFYDWPQVLSDRQHISLFLDEETFAGFLYALNQLNFFINLKKIKNNLIRNILNRFFPRMWSW